MPKDKPESIEIVDGGLSSAVEKITDEELALLKQYLPDLVKRVLLLADQDEE